MKKIFRWAIVLLGCLLVLLGIASGLAWYYKPEITQAIHHRIRERVNGEFDIGSISMTLFEDFPNVSITLQDIYLWGPKYPLYKKAFFKSKKILINVNLGKLLLKEVNVESIKIIQGEVFIFRTRTGYTDLDVFKTNEPIHKDSTASPFRGSFSVDKIFYDDVKLDYHDSLKEKTFGVRLIRGENDIHRTDSSHQFHYTGKIKFDRLEFNRAKGSYLLGQSAEVKLNYEYARARHELTVHPSTLKFAKSTVGLSGKFNLTPTGTFSLDFDSKDMKYSEGLSLLPLALSKKLTKYNIQTPFGILVQVRGELTPGSQPSVDVHFTTKDTRVSVGKYQAEHVSMKGSFTNHRDDMKQFDDGNSVVEISSFSGIFNRLPMKGEATFMDLDDPYARLKISIDAEARSMQRELDSSLYQIGGGRFGIRVAYSGKLKEYLDPNKSRFSGKLTGTAELKKVKLVWVKHSLSVENVNAVISFTESRFLIESFTFLFNKSPVSVQGSVTGFVPFFSIPSKKGIVKLQVSSPNMNFTPTASKASKTRIKQSKDQSKKMISDLIDQLYSQLEFALAVNIKQFQYKSFRAKDLTGTITLANNQLQATPIKMKLAGGDVQLTFGLTNLQNQINPFWLKGNVRQAAIKEFFYTFNNFNQQTISYENLSGSINATINLKAAIDDNLNIRMSSLNGNVDLTVRDGQLKNFAPMEKLSNFLFKNRDLADVKFAEIKSNFVLRGTELTIGRMEVQSNVISLFLEGRYSLADSTDLSIQLPLSNLKARDKTYKPKNVGVDTNVGPSIFLRARRDRNGDMEISYDPFRKFRRK